MREIYTKEEVSKLLKVSKPTIDNWFYSGKLKGFKQGRVVRFTETAIEEFIKKGESK